MFTIQWAKPNNWTLGSFSLCKIYYLTCLDIRVQHYTLVLPCPSIDRCPSNSNILNCLNDINLNFASYLWARRKERNPKCWAAPFAGTSTSPHYNLNTSCLEWHLTCFFSFFCIPCYTVSLDISILTEGPTWARGPLQWQLQLHVTAFCLSWNCLFSWPFPILNSESLEVTAPSLCLTLRNNVQNQLSV